MATDFENWLNAPDDESWDENDNPLAGGEVEPAAAPKPRTPRAPVDEDGQTRQPPQMPDFTAPRTPRASRGGRASYDDIALASNQFTSRSDVPLMTDEQAKYYGKTKGKMGITETARADYAAATGADAPENPFLAQAANMGTAVGGQLNANIQMDAAQTLIRDGDHLDDDDINAAMDNIMFGVFGPAKGWFAKNGVMEEWDNGIGKGFKDAKKRATARRRFAQQIAVDFVKERTAVQRNAATEEEGRGISHGGEFLTRGAGNIAYAMPFALGPAGIALQTAQQATSNAIGLHNDKYGYDDEGNFGIAAKGDDWGKAALKGTASAGFETATEIALGKVGMAVVKRGGKLIGADKVFSKVGSMLGEGAEKVLGKETKDAVAAWASRFGSRLGKVYKVTNDKLHIGGLPEEMLEELESAVFNAATGADTRDSEQVDAKGNRTTAWDRTSDAVCKFFTPSELGTMAETMILTMGAAPFAAKMMNRGNEKGLNSVIRRLDLMSEEDIASTDYNTKVAALDAWRNSLTDEQVIDRLKSGQGFLDKLCDKIEGKDGTAEDAKAINELKRGIMERIAANAGINLDELGKTYQPFQVRLRTKPDGTDVPDFKNVIRVGSDGSRGGKARTVEDADGSGISIEETATGYRVNLAPGAEHDGMDFGTFEEAVDFATKMKPKVILDREIDAKKREWIRAEFDENYKGANVYSAQDIDDALRFCKSEYGVDMAKNAHFDRSRKAWILDNGTVVLVRSNINSPTELKNIMRHELVGHGGMNGATFLDATFRNQDKVLARARAKEAALQKKRAAGEEIKPEDELTDAEHMALTKANADAAGYSEEEGRKEAVALNVEQTRHGADAIDRIVAMGRNALRSVGVNLETNQTDIDVAAAKREKELRRGDTGASGLLNNEDKDYRANVGSYSYERPAVAPKTAPAELTDADRAARANAEQASQAARIEQGHPFLWQYAMEQANGDVQGAIDFAQNIIGTDAKNGNHAEENYINEQVAKRENEADRQKRQTEAEAKARGELEAETQERWEKNIQERTAREREKHEGAKLRRADEREKREAEGLEGPERDNIELQRRIDRMKQNHPAVWEFALRQAKAAGQHGAAAMDYAEQIVRADAQNKNSKGERAAAAMVAADKARNRENLTAEEAKILVKHGLNLPGIGYVQGSGQKYVEDTRTGKGRWVWDGGLVYDIERDTTPDGPRAAAERAAKERDAKAKEELAARQLNQREREDTERMRKTGLNRQNSIPDWRETNASQFAAEAEQERLHRERVAAEEEARRKAEEERIADFAAKFNGGADITQAEIDALPEAERANFAKEMREAGYKFFKKSGTWHKAAPKLRGGKVASASTQTTETKENTNEGGSEEGPVQGPVQAGPQGGQGGGQGQGGPVREGEPVREGQKVKDDNKSNVNVQDGGEAAKETSAPAAASTSSENSDAEDSDSHRPDSSVWEDDGTGTKRPHRRVLPQTEEEKRAVYDEEYLDDRLNRLSSIIERQTADIASKLNTETLTDSDVADAARLLNGGTVRGGNFTDDRYVDGLKKNRDAFENLVHYNGLLDFAPDGKQTFREKLSEMNEKIAAAESNVAALKKRLADEAKEAEPHKRGRGRPRKLTAEEAAAQEAQRSEAEKKARDLADRKAAKEAERARRIQIENSPEVRNWVESDERHQVFFDFYEAQLKNDANAMRDALARLKSADEAHGLASIQSAFHTRLQGIIDNGGSTSERDFAREELKRKPAGLKSKAQSGNDLNLMNLIGAGNEAFGDAETYERERGKEREEERTKKRVEAEERYAAWRDRLLRAWDGDPKRVKLAMENKTLKDFANAVWKSNDELFAKIEDWSSRSYKKNEKIVKIYNANSVDADDSGIVGATTIGAANERRRANRIKDLEHEIERNVKDILDLVPQEDVVDLYPKANATRDEARLAFMRAMLVKASMDYDSDPQDKGLRDKYHVAQSEYAALQKIVADGVKIGKPTGNPNKVEAKPAKAVPQKLLTPEEARKRAELKQKAAAALGAMVFGKSVAELQQSRKQDEYRLHNLNRQLDDAPDQQTHARLMPQIRNTEQRLRYWDIALEEAGRREGVDPNAAAPVAPAQTDNKLRRAAREARKALAEDFGTDDGFHFYSPELTTRESEEANGEADFYSDEISSRSAKEKAQNKYLTNFADRFHPVKTAVRDILMDGGMTRDEANRAAEADETSPYHQKRVQSGKAEADLVRVRAFGNDLEEDIKRLAKQNLTVDDIGVYAYALHAPARNRQKLIESKGKVVDGSGISTALATDILNGRPFRLDSNPKSPLRAYTTAQLAELKQAHDRIVHRLNDNFGLNYLYDAGLIDQQSVDTLTAAYGRDWVSLADDVDEDGVEYGRLPGATVMNPLKRAHGRRTALKDNPVITTFLGAERNILAAKKNMAAESLARFVEAHPEMGTVSEIYPNESINDSCVTFRRNVEDPNPWGERNARMVIRLKGERGREIARSFNEADVQRGPGWLQSLSCIWASFATQLSPTFSVRNFLKDTNEVTLDITGTLGTKAAADFVKGQAVLNPLTNKDFRDMMRTWRETGEIVGNSPMVDEFRRFVKAGGLIGGGGSREGYGEMHDRLANETMLKKIAAQFKAQNAVKPVRALGEAWNAYADLIGGVNENIEMLSRFNNFRTRIANGQSDEEAAINSREGSTDFGMYGNQRWMNSVWMFSNSILGGTLRAAKTLTVGKYGRRLAAGMFALGMVEGFADALMNGDDDDREKTGDPTHRDIKEYDWQNSLHLRFGGTLVRIPIHAGPYSILKYAGNNTARWMMGKISGGQAIENTVNQVATILTHFTGTGEHGVGKDTPSLVASLTPSAVAQPLVQIAMNEDYKGDRIHRVNSVGAAKNSPAYKLAKSDTNAVWVEMSRILNNLPFGGGTDYVKGRWDVAPESMQYLFKQIVKNLGSDVVNTALTAKNVFDTVTTGENRIENNDVPFWRDVVRRAPDARGRYYEALEEHEREAYAYKNAPAKEKREYLREHPNAARTDLKPIEKRIKELSSLSHGDVLDNRGSVVRHIEIDTKRKEAIDKETKRLMAVYLKRLGKNGDNKLRRGR